MESSIFAASLSSSPLSLSLSEFLSESAGMTDDSKTRRVYLRHFFFCTRPRVHSWICVSTRAWVRATVYISLCVVKFSCATSG